MEPSIQSEIS